VPSRREIRLGKDIGRGNRLELNRNLSLGVYNLPGKKCIAIELFGAFVLKCDCDVPAGPRFEFGGIEHMILERQPKREWIVCTNVHGEGRKRCGQEHYRKTDKWHYYACSFSGCPRPPQTYLL
jgi:hypothetical protein